MKKRHLFSRNVNITDGAYDYSTAVSREDTICALVENSRLSRQKTDAYWKKMKRYYDGMHDINYLTGTFSEDMNLPWKPAQSSDGYIHVESQIDPEIPGFEFSPRNGYSSELARLREETVRSVCDANFLADMNIKNERRLNISGSAVWKIGWGINPSHGAGKQDVVIENPKPWQIYTDPAAETLDSSEYVAYVYPMHVQRAKRIFGADFARKNEKIDDYISSPKENYPTFDDFYEETPDCVTVTEFWFRQPKDSKAGNFKAGDIAVSILVNGREVRYVPKYWKNTNCSFFPFVIYNKVPCENSIWGKSELEMLVPIIDAADRELTFAQMNSAFCSNDVILAEENAFADGALPENTPGAVWKLRPGMTGKVQRLGNLGSTQISQFYNYTVWKTMMEETTGNYEANQGKEPTRVTTASGIALLNERAKSRLMLKKAGKSEGFKRLFMLIDYTALEFYKRGRHIDSENGGFDFGMLTDGRDFCENYTPNIDVKIHIGDGLTNSKAFTVSAINALISTDITKDNYVFVKAYVDLVGLPMRNEICRYLDEKFGNYGENDRETENLTDGITA